MGGESILKNGTLKYRGENTVKIGQKWGKISVNGENLHRNGEIRWKITKYRGKFGFNREISLKSQGEDLSWWPGGGGNLLFRWKIYIPGIGIIMLFS